MFREMRACLGLLFIMLLLCGAAYPFASLGIGQALFYANAQGNLVGDKGKLIGSSLIGQNFAQQEYFHGRPSSAGNDGYDAMHSGASNLPPTSPLLRLKVSERIAAWRAAGIQSPIPSDLVTGSASGLDPHISPASAYFQAEIIASKRDLKIQKINELIASLTEPRGLGVLGEPRINVLALNRALDAIAPTAPLQTQADPGLVIPYSEHASPLVTPSMSPSIPGAP